MSNPTAEEFLLACELNQLRCQHERQHEQVIDQLAAVLERKLQLDNLERFAVLGSEESARLRAHSAEVAAAVLSELRAALQLTGEVLAAAENRMQTWKARN